MKKKILALCLVVVLAVTAVTGATLAYFTDTDVEKNTFTIGDVEIDLNEEFIQESELMPGKDVNKDAWIKNEGSNAAWVWAEVLIPEQLDDGIANSPSAPGAANSLHVNFPGKYSTEYANTADKWTNTDGKLWTHQYNADGINYGFVGTENVEGVWYNKYVKFYTEKLESGAETSLFMDKVYMDSKVEQCKEHDKCMILVDGSHYSGVWNILVRAYAIQEEGFDDVISAWKSYDGDYVAIDREQTPDDEPTPAPSDTPADGGEG